MKAPLLVLLLSAALQSLAKKIPQSVEEAVNGQDFTKQLRELNELYELVESIDQIKKKILPKAIALSDETVAEPVRLQKKLCDVRSVLAGVEDFSHESTVPMLHSGELADTTISIYINDHIEGINLFTEQIQEETKEITVDVATENQVEMQKLSNIREKTGSLVHKWDELNDELKAHIGKILDNACHFVIGVGQNFVYNHADDIIEFGNEALTYMLSVKAEVEESERTLQEMLALAEAAEFPEYYNVQNRIEEELAALRASSNSIDDCQVKLDAIKSVALALQTKMGEPKLSCKTSKRLIP